ncbi:MAG TPA: hypothetical protein VM889_07860, partial [Candidatus Thermoplasmatota archaeon]|nr:hypothetical protein [Candidatus Thermoplasmatota archaeon]
MRLALAALLALAGEACALAVLDEGPLVHEGHGTDTARFRLRVRVEGDDPVEVRASLADGFRGTLATLPASRAGAGEPRPLPATFALDPRAADARWRGYAGVYVLDIAVAAPNAGGRFEGTLLVVPERGAGVAVPFALALVEQRVAAVLEPGDGGATLRLVAEGGKRVVAAEARAAGAAHPLARVAPQTFAGRVPAGAVAEPVVVYWDGARLAGEPVPVPAPAPAPEPRLDPP